MPEIFGVIFTVQPLDTRLPRLLFYYIPRKVFKKVTELAEHLELEVEGAEDWGVTNSEL